MSNVCEMLPWLVPLRSIECWPSEGDQKFDAMRSMLLAFHDAIVPFTHFALLTDEYAHKYGVDPKDIALVAVKNHANGAKNPNAQRQKVRTLEEVLGGKPISGTLTALQCTPVGEGAAVCPGRHAAWHPCQSGDHTAGSSVRECPGSQAQPCVGDVERDRENQRLPQGLACTVHPPLSSWGNFHKDEWELFHLETDRSQSTNVAADHPDRLEQLKGLWFYYAGIYNGLPIDDRNALEQVLSPRPHGAPDRDQYIFYPGASDVPESAGPQIPGRSYTIAAGIEVTSDDVEGVIWAAGGVPGGHSLYVKDNTLRYTFNWVGTHLQDVVSSTPLSQGRHLCVAEFTASGPSTNPERPGTEGTLTLYVDDQQVAQAPLITQPGYFCLTGDGICVGRDSASAVSPGYQAPFPFTGGSIDKVVVDLSGDPYPDHEARVRTWFSLD